MTFLWYNIRQYYCINCMDPQKPDNVIEDTVPGEVIQFYSKTFWNLTKQKRLRQRNRCLLHAARLWAKYTWYLISFLNFLKANNSLITNEDNQKNAYLIACSLWALRISGFMLRLAKISVREAPTMARWNFCVRLVLFFVCSSSWPFLCLRLKDKSHLR